MSRTGGERPTIPSPTLRGRECRRRHRGWPWGALFLAAGLAPVHLFAQGDATNAASGNRCLLVVDTSRAMQRRTEATLKVVQDLVMSGLDGQLRPGDTLGLWTFNDALYTGRIPLQKWSPEARKEIASRTITFLRAQPCEKRADFAKVAPALAGVVGASAHVTVILISAGDEMVVGTPFDAPINEFYRRWHDQQRKARLPFVTVLSAQNGQVADYALNMPPLPVQFPHPLQEARAEKTTQLRLPAALPKALSAKPELAPAKVEVPVPPVVEADTSKPAVIKPPEPAAPPVEVAKAEPMPVVTEKPVVELPPAVAPKVEVAKATEPEPASVPRAVAEPKVEAVKATQAKPAEPTAAKPEAAPLPPSPTPKPQPVAIEPLKPAPVPEPKVEAVKATQAKPAEPTAARPEATPLPPAPIPRPQPVAIESPKPAPVPESKPAAIPTPPAAKAVIAGTAAATTGTVSAPQRQVPVAPPSPSPPVPPAQAATATPTEALVSHTGLWIAASVLAVVAAGSFVLLRRSRAVSQGSLITRSIERRKKP